MHLKLALCHGNLVTNITPKHKQPPLQSSCIRMGEYMEIDHIRSPRRAASGEITTKRNRMNTIATQLGFNIALNMSFDNALDHVTNALKAEGFGILTEIDVKDTLKKKLDVDFRPYKILGACNPPLAYRALTVAPEVGLLLPCNVTVSQADSGLVDVFLIDPLMMLGVAANPALEPIAQEARQRLERVAAAMAEL